MTNNSDKIIDDLIARSADGFLNLNSILDEGSLDKSRRIKEDLENLIQQTEEHPEIRVLVVDDDKQVSAVVERQLIRRGFNVSISDSAAKAWKLIDQLSPHVIVSDVLMPETNGLEFLAEVVLRNPNIVVILCSGAPDIQMTIDALRLGATDFLVKPINFDHLEEAIHRGLKRRQARYDQLRYQLNLELMVSEKSERLIEYSEALEERTRQLGHSYRDVLVRLGRASQWRDDETGAHVQRIGIFSSEIARHLGLPDNDVDLIAEASPLHDIGKIGVPDSILLKPSRLTPEEFDIMKRHTVIGAAILSGSNAPLLKASEEIALSHHEWWNGGGYPRGVAGADIPLFGQIVTIVDVYDALIHPRSYKEAVPFDETISTITARRGTQFAPEITDAFIEVVDTFPKLERRLAESTQIVNAKYGVRMGLFKLNEQETSNPELRKD